MESAAEKSSPRRNQTVIAAWDSQIRFCNDLKYPKWYVTLQAGNRFPKKQATESL
jgi:hypothetical protein